MNDDSDDDDDDDDDDGDDEYTHNVRVQTLSTQPC